MGRLAFLEPEGKVGYRYGQDGAEREAMDYLEFIAQVTSHIPDKGQVMVRYYGLYANAHRGKVRKAGVSPLVLRMAEDRKPVPSKGWAAMIRNIFKVGRFRERGEVLRLLGDFPVDCVDDLAGGPVSRPSSCC